jgi:ribonuclease D
VIATQTELDALLQRLAGQRAVAVDCEMDSMYAYRTSLCLVQLGWEGGEALIDALAPLRRDALGALFADKSVLKVFHGGENDVGLMRAHWGFEFENVFDTMAASQVLGADGVGLQALLLRHFNVHVSKKFQKADWRVRPLPPDQAEYAKMDVRYLLPLREILDGQLTGKGRVEEARSEFRRIARARIEERPFDPDNWIRIKGARELDPRRRGVLRELFIARDELARQFDRAPYRVLNESTLVDIAERLPESAAALRRVPAVGRHLTAAHLDRLVAAVARGREVEDLPLPRRERPGPGDRFGAGPMTPEQIAAFDALRAWRQRRAEARGVEVARVATNNLLSAIVRAHPGSPAELAAVDGMEDWRLREYGEELLAVLRDAGGSASGAATTGGSAC